MKDLVAWEFLFCNILTTYTINVSDGKISLMKSPLQCDGSLT